MKARTEQQSIAAEMAAHVIQEMDELKMRPGNGTSMSPLRPTLGEMTGLLEHAIEKLSAAHKVPGTNAALEKARDEAIARAEDEAERLVRGR